MKNSLIFFYNLNLKINQVFSKLHQIGKDYLEDKLDTNNR
ncbi:hypothetical protein HOLDEFILI_00953 [Holdemania filiformis DSM 12042]|uniref:Uncharacterized protein n=1 Tax=Holdemania filiformis DSM 12042 TaxID=545696 RepID=B9Y572_9FIRM|nr:hypothetical protein HOLDEFILI_00953 [Holdemania filiformis DSM 12042]